jgi:hypothetical protein
MTDFIDPRLVAQFAKTQRQNIIDNIPTGSHRARAEAWRRLARRCEQAADRHDAVADLRSATRAYVHQFAPEHRQAALQQLIAKGEPVDAADVSLTAPRAPADSKKVAEAILQRWDEVDPHAAEYRRWMSQPATDCWVDGQGYVHTCVVEPNLQSGNEDGPEKP